MSQVKMQLLGFMLAAATAFGCIAYEKLVKSYPYCFVGFLTSMSYVPFWLIAWYNRSEAQQHCSNWWVVAYIVSGCTGPLWYYITKDSNVVIGAVFELKYIVILAVFYSIFGNNKLTWNTTIGVGLAIASIYIITKKD